MKATHRGNCQVCGHQQHVMSDGLALHGYTVTFGYFQGTCRGSGHPPVQTERTLTDATIVGLGHYAVQCDASVERLKSGATKPARVKTGDKYNSNTYKLEAVFVEFSLGTPEQQKKAIEIAIWECEQDARGARDHAIDLGKMADELYGTALVSIDDLMKARIPAPKATVDVKTAKVHGTFGSKAARKAELDKVNRLFDVQHRMLSALTLNTPHAARTEAMNEVYYGPMQLSHWRPKHSTKALEVFPQAKEIVTTIEELVKAREAIKAAP